MRTGTSYEVTSTRAFATLTGRHPDRSPSSTHTPSLRGLSILAGTSLSLNAGIRTVLQSVTCACTITGSEDLSSIVIVIPRLPNRRSRCPISSEHWFSPRKSPPNMASAVRADVTTICGVEMLPSNFDVNKGGFPNLQWAACSSNQRSPCPGFQRSGH